MVWSIEKIIIMLVGLWLALTMGTDLMAGSFGLGRQTEGQVLSAEVRPKFFFYELEVRYDYVVQQKRRVGRALNSIFFGYYSWNRGDAQGVADELLALPVRLVFYDAQWPERSFIQTKDVVRGVPWKVAFLFLGIFLCVHSTVDDWRRIFMATSQEPPDDL